MHTYDFKMAPRVHFGSLGAHDTLFMWTFFKLHPRVHFENMTGGFYIVVDPSEALEVSPVS